jgi:hypothetical protein
MSEKFATAESVVCVAVATTSDADRQQMSTQYVPRHSTPGRKMPARRRWISQFVPRAMRSRVARGEE